MADTLAEDAILSVLGTLIPRTRVEIVLIQGLGGGFSTIFSRITTATSRGFVSGCIEGR